MGEATGGTARAGRGGSVKAADIPDDAFIAAVRSTRAVDGSLDDDHWRMRWDVQATLEGNLGPIPEKVFLAKARRLMNRGLLDGCPCGCRGDYNIPAGTAAA